MDTSASFKSHSAGNTWRAVGASLTALVLALPAMAQEALPFPGRTATVAITPTVADAGAVRVITVSGMWNNGCIPVGASGSTGASAGETLYAVTLALPQTLAPCTAAFTPYTRSITVTPDSRGRFRVLAKTSLGEYLAEAVIDVRAASDDRPRADITGVWYEPSTNGSGLTFVQSARVPDLVFGTWYVYSADGGSRWYTIQNTTWRSQGSVLEGDLYETRAAAGSPCPAPLESCPVPFTALAILGRARFTLSDEHNGRIEALTTLGSTLFASNITRIRF